MAATTKYPGAGLALRYVKVLYGEEAGREYYRYGSTKYLPGAVSPLIQVREVFMMILMDRLTDKPNWHEKVFNDEIVAKWKAEALSMPEADIYNEIVDPSRKVRMPSRTRYMTEEVFNYCIEELRCKAKHFEKTGLIFTLNSSRASDAESNEVNTVIKSDSLVDEELRQAFIAAFEKLRAEQGDNPDWHPDTNEMVQDLVHPSLYPFAYGQSNFFQGEVVGVEDAIDKWSGKGKPIEPTKEGPNGEGNIQWNAWDRIPWAFYSQKYQWLPANLAFQEDGTVRFTSYINNLHPKRHASTYRLIEKLIDIAIPAWDSVCSIKTVTASGQDQMRLPFPPPVDEEDDEHFEPLNPEILAEHEAKNGPCDVPRYWEPDWLDDDEIEEAMEDEEAKNERKLQRYKWREIRDPILLAPNKWEPIEFKVLQSMRERFRDTGLQVIVKMASIELTPEKPEFPAGGWHIEGMLNEHIVATALFYIDSENVTESHLSFRMATETDQRELRDQCGQGAFGYYERLYGNRLGSSWDTDTIQVYGSVKTPQGRFLAFPNVFQHRVSSFRIQDPTKPGHRRFIALWLVDPHTRIISTANVPPQRFDWWCEATFGTGEGAKTGDFPAEVFQLLLERGGAEVVKPSEELLSSLRSKLPAEILEMVRSSGPVPEGLMTLEEAREHRTQLMKERSAFIERSKRTDWRGDYSFCEH